MKIVSYFSHQLFVQSVPIFSIYELFYIQRKVFGVHGLRGQSVHVHVAAMVSQSVNDGVCLVKTVQDIVMIPSNVVLKCVQVR